MNSGKNFAVVYRQLIQDLLFTGKEVEAIRGRKTKEILNYSICIENPASNLVYIKGRKFSIMHAIQESLGLVIANNSVEFASLFNERMKDFSDDGKTCKPCPMLDDVSGVYESRCGDGIEVCYIPEDVQIHDETGTYEFTTTCWWTY